MQCKNPADIMDTYFRGLVARNPAKYTRYVYGIKRVIPLILRLPWTVKNAHKILPITYAVCRIVDDYVDGDFEDVWNADIVDYVRKRIAFLDAYAQGEKREIYTPEDRLFDHMFSLTTHQAETHRIQVATKRIVESMLFDALRIQQYKKTWELEFPHAKDLFDHFVLMDVLWTGDGLSTLIHLWGDTTKSVRAVGIACRIQYTLKDLPEDIRAGIVNITKEDAEAYGVTIDDLKRVRDLLPVSSVNPKSPSLIMYQDASEYPESIKKWIRYQIDEYERLMWTVNSEDIKKLSLHARFFYRFAYKWPSDTVIAQLKNKFYA